MSLPKSYTLTVFFILFSVVSIGVKAEPQLVIHPYIGLELGMGTYSFEQKLDQTIVFPVANLTTGLAVERFNVALNCSGSASSAEVSEEDFLGDADRLDIDVTVGYQINQLFSVFAGYKTGKTSLDLTSRNTANPATGSEFYKQQGLFAGISMVKKFTNAGNLDFSLAYARLNTENRFFSDNDISPEEQPEFDDIDGKTSGKSTGLSLNTGWTMPLQGNLLFRTKLRYNHYQQDIETDGLKFEGIREKSTMLMVGVIAVF